MKKEAVWAVPALLAAEGLYHVYKKGRAGWIMVLLFFYLAGVFRMGEVNRNWTDPSLMNAVGGREVILEGRVVSLSGKEAGDVLILKNCLLRQERELSPAGRVMVYLKPGWEEELGQPFHIGMTVAVRGELKEFDRARNPGGFDARTYYLGLKIRYRLSAEAVESCRKGWSPAADGLYRLRKRCLNILEGICEPQDAGIFQAALLGEKENLDAGIKKLYQKNGIAHLLAISGLHISLIGAGCYRLLRRGGLGFYWSGLAAGIWIICYGYMTGGSASVVRAVWMLLLLMLAEALGRTYDLLTAASLAALLLVWDSPWLLFSGGFQLSFGAVFAIAVPGKWLCHPNRCRFSWQKALASGLAIQWVTYPVLRYHFFEYPLYSVFLNLLVIPLMTFVVCSGAAGILFGFAGPIPGRMAVGTGHYILRLYEWLCEKAGGLPGSSLILGRPELWQIAVYYVFLLAVCLWVKHRWREETGKAGKAVFYTISLFVPVLILWKLPVREMQVTFLDVGQGDGIVIEYRDLVITVDGGSTSEKKLGEYTLEPFLKSRGISQVDYAFITHGDEDHISGIRYLLEEDCGIEVSSLILPYHRQEDENCRELEALSGERGTLVHEFARSDVLKGGELSVRCLYPGKEDVPSDINEESLVLEVELGEFRMLLTGDMSGDGEKRLVEYGIRPTQVLKAAHHGSKYSNTQTFLQQVRPVWGVLSYGEGNRYGHPHEEVKERLGEAGTELWETAKSGAVMVWTDGEIVRWEPYIPKRQVDGRGGAPYNKD